MGNFYQQNPKPEMGAGLYLKFEDGKEFRLRIVSEPVVVDSIFDEGGPKEKLGTKYAWIVWNFDEGIAQIMQLPPTATGQVWDLCEDEDWGDPMETPWNVKIKRTGTSTKTKYTVVPSASKGELPDEALELIAEVDIIKAIESGQSVQRVMWWRDAVSEPKTSQTAPVKATAPKKDVVIEDIGDEPINLDDIPF